MIREVGAVLYAVWVLFVHFAVIHELYSLLVWLGWLA